MMSRGCAVIFEGLNVRVPFSPTSTLWTTGGSLGVGFGEPGYDPYVVVHVVPPSVTVCVTVTTDSEGGGVVTVSILDVAVEGGGDVVVVVLLLTPLPKALARNLSKVWLPVVGAFIAKTIP